jgi:hypothetical protein
MRAGKRPIKVVPFPGDTEQKVGLRLPSDFDKEQARLEAYRYLASKGVDLGGPMDDQPRLGAVLLNEERLARLLASCLVTEDSALPEAPLTMLCEGVADMRAHITDKQKDALLHELGDFMAECDPDPDTRAGALRAAEILGELEKKAGSRAALLDSLRGLSPDMLRDCLISMVERLATSASAKSSST